MLTFQIIGDKGSDCIDCSVDVQVFFFKSYVVYLGVGQKLSPRPSRALKFLGGLMVVVRSWHDMFVGWVK